MLLMLNDMPVMHIDIDKGDYEVFEPDKLPYQLSGRFRDMPVITGENPKYEATQYAIALAHNNEKVTDWLASRVLPLTRKNAKKIYQLFGYEQLQDSYSKARIAITCRAASLQDNYWIKLENDPISWDGVNLRHCSLNEVVAQVSLHGSSLTLNGAGGEIKTPELNGQGAYAKAWIREKDGLYLHKVSADDNDIESHLEVCVSNILDKCNVAHVRYMDGENNGKYTCKCRCMTTDQISILPGMDLISWANVTGQNPDTIIMKTDADSIYKMWIVDYLISNRDRHGQNWGYLYEAGSMEILGCHPLFDHNNAFDPDLMVNKDAEYLFNKNITMKQAAEIAMAHTDFHFTDTITKDDFMTVDQYNSFMDRADELKIEIDRDNIEDHIVNKAKELCHVKAPEISFRNTSIEEQLASVGLTAANALSEYIAQNPEHKHAIINAVLTEKPELYRELDTVRHHSEQTISFSELV